VQIAAQFLRHMHGSPGIGGRYDDGEFLAPVACNEVTCAVEGRTHGLGDLLQALVSGKVSARIVVGLEIIDVAQDQGQRCRGPCGAPYLLVQHLVEITAVGDSCETIGTRLLEELLIGGLQFGPCAEQCRFRLFALGDVAQNADECPAARDR
jgi:hypothetical protein